MSARLTRTAVCAALAVCALGGAVACGRSALHAAQESAEGLAQAVLIALEHKDVAALEALALSEEEFRNVVWPELPAARPERNLPAEYVWAELRTKSETDLRRLVERRGGQRFSLVGVEFTGRTTQYQTFLVHRDARLTLRDREGGQETTRLFGSVLERDGRFKVFSYITD